MRIRGAAPARAGTRVTCACTGCRGALGLGPSGTPGPWSLARVGRRLRPARVGAVPPQPGAPPHLRGGVRTAPGPPAASRSRVKTVTMERAPSCSARSSALRHGPLTLPAGGAPVPAPPRAGGVCRGPRTPALWSRPVLQRWCVCCVGAEPARVAPASLSLGRSPGRARAAAPPHPPPSSPWPPGGPRGFPRRLPGTPAAGFSGQAAEVERWSAVGEGITPVRAAA